MTAEVKPPPLLPRLLLPPPLTLRCAHAHACTTFPPAAASLNVEALQRCQSGTLCDLKTKSPWGVSSVRVEGIWGLNVVTELFPLTLAIRD